MHGVLHLLNYDHADDHEAASMQRRERELLARFRQLERLKAGQMGGADWVILAVVVVLFVLSIFFAAAETAFTRMSRIRAIALAEDGDKRARASSRRCSRRPEQTLNVGAAHRPRRQLTAATLIGVLLEGTLGRARRGPRHRARRSSCSS